MDRKTYKILFVDDNDIDRMLSQRYLERDPHHQFEFFGVASAQEAYSLIEENIFHCILVDYLLPDENGLDFIENLQKIYDVCPPIIMMTGQGNENVAAKAINVGVSDYIIKSYITAIGLRRAVLNVIEKNSLIHKIKLKNLELKKANVELERLNQEILRSYQVLSHELKTPLTAIYGFLTILNDQLVGPVNSEQAELLQYAIESCELMKLYINDLLKASLIDAAKVNLNLEAYSIEKIIDVAMSMVKDLAEKNNIAIKAKIEPNLPDCWVDYQRITQVLINLINNAIKFSYPNNQVEIHVKRESDLNYIRIEIADYGIGIPDSELSKIFERFYQYRQQETDPNSGLGLGLSICKQLVNLHGGDISVSSQYQKGSTFIFTVPVVPERRPGYEENHDCG